MQRSLVCVLAGILLLSATGCGRQARNSEMEQFLTTHVGTIKPMEKAANLASWDAERSGKSEDFDKLSELQLELNKVYMNKDEFARLKDLKECGCVTEPRLKRQLDILYTSYLRNQIDPELLKQTVELSNEIAMKFNTFRGTIDGKTITDNAIREVLKTETDSAKRQKAWLAGKQVGPAVAADIIQLVKLRNQIAETLGFDNFHTMSLILSEQDVGELDRIFAELAELTNQPFMELKAGIDVVLAERYAVPLGSLRPWHYHDPFFQEAPAVLELDLDGYYKGKNIEELARTFYAGINLPVESILDDSDLYERPGKSPHAFCTDIDRSGDVRVLCNVKDNEKWMEVMLHELGHAVYGKFYDPQMPYLLRDSAHIFTTEGIAMFFGRLSSNADWMQQMLQLSDSDRDAIAQVSAKYARMKQLVFARWAMVMYQFEKALYADPDQDLNSLWWKLVKKYQLVTPPDNRNQPDWAAKIHIASAPCYYHNYLLGELFASQLHNYIVHDILKEASDEHVSYVGAKEVGDYLRNNVFQPGRQWEWNEMIRRATGSQLSPEYFVRQFVN